MLILSSREWQRRYSSCQSFIEIGFEIKNLGEPSFDPSPILSPEPIKELLPPDGVAPPPSLWVKAFFWNIRGLNDPVKHTLFVNWLASQKACFGAILESHVKEPQLNHVMNQTCRDWSYLSNHDSDPDGRIIIIWKHPASVNPLHQTRQSLTCEITIGASRKFIFTAIYAANTPPERTDLWIDLLNLNQTMSLDAHPWVVGEISTKLPITLSTRFLQWTLLILPCLSFVILLLTLDFLTLDTMVLCSLGPISAPPPP